jgi:hypothetical protein
MFFANITDYKSAKLSNTAKANSLDREKSTYNGLILSIYVHHYYYSSLISLFNSLLAQQKENCSELHMLYEFIAFTASCNTYDECIGP